MWRLLGIFVGRLIGRAGFRRDEACVDRLVRTGWLLCRIESDQRTQRDRRNWCCVGRSGEQSLNICYYSPVPGFCPTSGDGAGEKNLTADEWLAEELKKGK